MRYILVSGLHGLPKVALSAVNEHFLCPWQIFITVSVVYNAGHAVAMICCLQMRNFIKTEKNVFSTYVQSLLSHHLAVNTASFHVPFVRNWHRRLQFSSTDCTSIEQHRSRKLLCFETHLENVTKEFLCNFAITCSPNFQRQTWKLKLWVNNQSNLITSFSALK